MLKLNKKEQFLSELHRTDNCYVSEAIELSKLLLPKSEVRSWTNYWGRVRLN